ncbi:hypothetical protein LPJ62_006509, partial [Coemansia sp. RSA 2167]
WQRRRLRVRMRRRLRVRRRLRLRVRRRLARERNGRGMRHRTVVRPVLKRKRVQLTRA